MPAPMLIPRGQDEVMASAESSVACVRGARPQAPGMFMVHDEAAEAIRRAFDEDGEPSAVAELRRRFPATTNGADARRCVHAILGWTWRPDPDRERG